MGLRPAAGLLAPGPTPPRLPDRRWRIGGSRAHAPRRASPVTVAGPRRIRPGFPSPL